MIRTRSLQCSAVKSCLTITILVLTSLPCLGVPAFPGAEGFGTDTAGGRGGRVLFVDNLNDDGPGSFRAALRAEGKRIVVFRTGGLITLSSGIDIVEPFLTVAGQTAPGDGICIKASPTMRGTLFAIKTHDVIFRGLRIRAGAEGEPPIADNRDCLQIGTTANYSPAKGTGRAHDIVVDHCSFSWSVDENISVWCKNRNVTIQNCIISEGLHYSIHSKSQDPPPKGQPYPYSHSTGLLVGGGGTLNTTLHHNLFAHNYRRNPRICGRTSVEIVNNVVYNWGGRGLHFTGDGKGPILASVIANHFQPGPNSGKDGACVFIDPGKTAPEFGSGFYLQGNLSGTRGSPDEDDWKVAKGWKDRRQMEDAYRRNEPAFKASDIVIDGDTANVLENVLAGAGAMPRDAVDERIVNDVRNGTGKQIDDPSDVGGFPEYSTGTSPVDADDDGMPDAWEEEHGLDPQKPNAEDADLSDQGYTNIEVYINGLLE